ncbi:MAG: carboxylesterase family protein [Pigmentiphaga sp.]|nr:carboxylesterase family protein [Pigmentiphaga sp.]
MTMGAPIEATIRQGIVTGRYEQGVCRFSAIPFAQAPVGALRFKPPVPADWAGRLDATAPGPVAPQLRSRLVEAMGDFERAQSEDCLRLTVWTPNPDRQRRPVVVWLHGGAHQSGGGDLDWYDGAQLAARGNLVVVAPNYRLAALGWLHLPDACSNLGLLDQEAALDWVHAHIESFGGDPDRVTVMGQSAGAQSIVGLLLRPARFKRAILQSAPLGRGFASKEWASSIRAHLMEAVGAQDLAALQAVPVQALLQAQQSARVRQALQEQTSKHNLFSPIADGSILPDNANALLRQASSRMDVLIGHTSNEMAAFTAIRDPEQQRSLSAEIYAEPAQAWARDATEQGRKAWLYRFEFAPSARFGACHCVELPFVFGTAEAFSKAPMLRGAARADIQRLTSALQHTWIQFIRNGDPGWEAWPQQHVFS